MTGPVPEKASVKGYLLDPSNNNVALEWREVNLESTKVSTKCLLKMAEQAMERMK